MRLLRFVYAEALAGLGTAYLQILSEELADTGLCQIHVRCIISSPSRLLQEEMVRPYY
jgi:hypothetical protein